MNNMLSTIVPKSDQLNADDLIGGRSLTIKVTKVLILAGEQPVALSYEGDNGKPYKPGKSMRRVLVHCWGSDGNKYIGRSMTLYRDEKVKFGGEVVGGIRISHMSDIAEPITMALTATRASRKPFTVQPLAVSAEPEANIADWISDIEKAATSMHLQQKFSAGQKIFRNDPDSLAQLVAAKDKRKAELTQPQGEVNANQE
jgi:hypothetical protein